MADHIISAICGGAGGVLTVGLLHLVRIVGTSRPRPIPASDLSAYRLPKE